MDPLFPDSLELSGLARLSTSPDPHAAAVSVALGRLSRLAARLLGTAGAFVALADGPTLRLAAGWGPDLELRPGSPLHALCWRTVEAGTLVVAPEQGAAAPGGGGPCGLFVGVPLTGQSGERLGLLAGVDGAPHPTPGADDLELFGDLAASVVAELERRAALSSAQANAALHRVILDTSLDAVVTFSTHGVTEWNLAAERLFGYGAPDFAGPGGRALLAGILGEETSAAVRRVLERPELPEPDRRITVMHRRSGDPVPVELTLLAFELQGERRCSLVLRDWTRQQNAQNELTAQRNLLRAALDGVPASMYVKDAQRRYLMINTAGARAIGQPAEAILGQTDEALWPPDIAAAVRERDEGVLRSGEQVTYEVTDRLPGGEEKSFWTTRTVYRDSQDAVAGLIGVSLDITGRKAAELALYQHTELLSRKVEDAQLEILERLAYAAEYRDDDTGEHMFRVGRVAAGLAGVLGLPPEEVEVIRRSAPLHDVGKVGIPEGILLKPGRLTPEEFGVVRGHCRIGAQILRGGRSAQIQAAETIALTHHERWDGQGYPAGLAGEAIPLLGRIVAVADVFDALTSTRPYKRAWPLQEAVAEIVAQSGRQFDPQVVDALRRLLAQESAGAGPADASPVVPPHRPSKSLEG